MDGLPGDKRRPRRRSRRNKNPQDPQQVQPPQVQRGMGRGPAAKRSGGAAKGGARGRGSGGGTGGRSVAKGQLPDNAIYGINPISVALSTEMLKALYYEPNSQSERVQQLHAQAADAGLPVQPLTKAGWARALTPDQHQGVAGLVHSVATHYLEEIIEQAGEDSCVLVLDRVQDPQNLGAILRSAAATGVDAVVLPKAGGAGITPAVHKASAGMSMKVNIVEDENLARALELLKEHGYWAIGCDSDTGTEDEPEDATTFEYPKKRVLVMGNEAEGLRRLVRDSCDFIVRIPMAEGVESLNVSVATAVVLYLAKADLAKAVDEPEPEG